MSDKKFSPREAAIAVLKKAEELYKSSTLAKGEIVTEKLSKSEEASNPDEKADAKLGEQVEKEVESHEAQNDAPEHDMPMKGHIKLAKFMGRMEHKKGQKIKEMDKAGPLSEPIGKPIAGKDMRAGEPNKSLLGMSDQGASVRGEDGKVSMSRAKQEASQSLNYQRSMPKPKLPG